MLTAFVDGSDRRLISLYRRHGFVVSAPFRTLGQAAVNITHVHGEKA